MFENVKVVKIVSKPLLAEPGGFFMTPLTEEQFKDAVSRIPEEDFVADTAFMSTALKTMTGRESAIGSRSLKLNGGEAAVVFEIDSVDAFNKNSVGSREGTFDSIDYVRSHCKMWMIIKIDVEQIMAQLQSDTELMGRMMATMSMRQKPGPN